MRPPIPSVFRPRAIAFIRWCLLSSAALMLLGSGAHAAPTAAHYRVTGDASELRILVFRAGLMAALGHNHVIATRALSGDIVLGAPAAASSMILEFPVNSLVVDEADLRAQEGSDFAADVDDDAIRATRENMLGPGLLDAVNHDTIRIESAEVAGEIPNLSMTVRLEVKGRQHDVLIPVSVNTFDGGLVAIGRVRLTHAAIGLEPFQAAFGSLRVADEMHIKFRILAVQMDR